MRRAAFHPEKSNRLKYITGCKTGLAMMVVASVASVALAVDPGGEQAALPDQARMAAQDICPVTGNQLGTHGTPVKVKIDHETVFLCCKDCTSGQIKPKHWATIQAKFAKARAQGICPVTGNQLGTHGTPVKVNIGRETIFLCCKGCTSGEIKPEHWTTIHANFVNAQATCPVMGNELPDNAKWTIVDGRIIYVCCPPCIQKIEDDPGTYLAKLDALYRKSVSAK
ncbi:MAG: hypothetical protein ACQESR_04810 [Planctomycetota bacterium]